MTSTPPRALKRPKLEPGGDDNGDGGTTVPEQEANLVALIEHRTNEVEHLRRRIAYYTTQIAQAENRLHESQSQLARLRGRHNSDGPTNGKEELTAASPGPIMEPSKKLSQPRTELVIPSVTPKTSQLAEAVGSWTKTATSNVKASPTSVDTPARVKVEKTSARSASKAVAEVKDRETKRKFGSNLTKIIFHLFLKIRWPSCTKALFVRKDGNVDQRQNASKQREHKILISLIRTKSSTTSTVKFQGSNHISSQHKRKLRSIAICPGNDQLFVTSSLDGMVNLWQLQSNCSSASFLSSTDCVSPIQRRWPEDIAWHPHENSLFCAYTADASDTQISILNLNKSQARDRVTFLENKPHVKGIINSILFMPWEESCFVTGGSDHAVVLWSERDAENVWKPKVLHRNMHSSAVMGIAGIHGKKLVLSAGADKRIIGFDITAERAEYRHQVDSKCMSVLPNPCDFNLFMVQTGTHERQLRLFDLRMRLQELHAFGWKQESSDSQSALINQAWSPDGFYITSGSADPMIHLFDIRYNSHKPSQSLRAHQKRVFQALWHYSLPLLISISSDLHIGLHKIA